MTITLEAFRAAVERTDDIGQLETLRSDLLDWLIEAMPEIIRAQQGVRKREQLRKRFHEFVAAKYGL